MPLLLSMFSFALVATAVTLLAPNWELQSNSDVEVYAWYAYSSQRHTQLNNQMKVLLQDSVTQDKGDESLNSIYATHLQVLGNWPHSDPIRPDSSILLIPAPGQYLYWKKKMRTRGQRWIDRNGEVLGTQIRFRIEDSIADYEWRDTGPGGPGTPGTPGGL